MKYFFIKLIPPRPTFPMDMTEAERAIMQEHSIYWAKIMKEGKVVAYGPVMDPNGAFGIAVVELEDDAAAQSIAENDPAIISMSGFRFELHQMPDAIVRT
jgi:uncharacterized protein